MCAEKLPTPFQLGYAAKPGAVNPFEPYSDDWRHWNFGFQAAAEEQAVEEDERERENYFAWGSWDQE